MNSYRATAAEVLTRHSSYIWNKSRTRIRCQGEDCAVVLDAPEGDPSAIAVFAAHQADQLPLPPTPAPAEQDRAEAPLPAQAEDMQEAQAPEEGEIDDPPADANEVEPVVGEPEAVASEDEPEPAKARKFRRDTKALTATIAELQKGDRVRATFNTPRYGLFTVEGTVLKGGAGLERSQFSVAGWYINLNERAAKALHGLEILAPAGQHEFAIPKPSELPEHIGIGS